MNTNLKVIGLTRLEIKPESTTAKADALSTRFVELLPTPTGMFGNQLQESLQTTQKFF